MECFANMSKNDHHQASSPKNLQEARRSLPFGSSRLRNHHSPWQTTWPQNKITEPKNITHAGTHAASVLTNVAPMPSHLQSTVDLGCGTLADSQPRISPRTHDSKLTELLAPPQTRPTTAQTEKHPHA